VSAARASCKLGSADAPRPRDNRPYRFAAGPIARGGVDRLPARHRRAAVRNNEGRLPRHRGWCRRSDRQTALPEPIARVGPGSVCRYQMRSRRSRKTKRQLPSHRTPPTGSVGNHSREGKLINDCAGRAGGEARLDDRVFEQDQYVSSGTLISQIGPTDEAPPGLVHSHLACAGVFRSCARARKAHRAGDRQRGPIRQERLPPRPTTRA